MRKAMVIGLVAILIGGIFGIGITGEERNTHSTANIEERGYTPHAPIYITSNSDFNSKHGVVGGSGTKDDPYIISGWEIKGGGKYNRSIDISGTTAHFVIEYCYIHNADEGIRLTEVYHGNITHNKISDNYHGISIMQSDDITIENNIISLNEGGIGLSGPLGGIHIHYNDFIDNTRNADIGEYAELSMGSFDYNYWSGYKGEDKDEDGYGDTPYHVGDDCDDNHPLMNPVNPTVEEENSPLAGFPWLWVILGIVIVAAIIIVIAVKRRRR